MTIVTIINNNVSAVSKTYEQEVIRAFGGDVPRALRRHPDAFEDACFFWIYRTSIKNLTSKRLREIEEREKRVRTSLERAGLSNMLIERFFKAAAEHQ